jgi:hypothetical protein
MTHRIPLGIAQVSANTPNASTAYNFDGAAVPDRGRPFNAAGLSTGDTLPYHAGIEGGAYERGLGTWNDTAKTLTRTTIRESSTGSAIDWTAAPTVWSDGPHQEDLLQIGTTATTACAGNDARLSDARTPASHTLDSHSGTLAKTKGGWGEDTTAIWDGATKTMTLTEAKNTLSALTLSGVSAGVSNPCVIIDRPGYDYADIGCISATKGIRMYGGTSYSTSAAFQIWGNTSAYKGMYFDAGSVANADIFFRNSSSGGATAIRIKGGGGAVSMGFYGATPIAKPTVSGSRGGNAALDSLLTALANLGFITNSTTA